MSRLRTAIVTAAIAAIICVVAMLSIVSVGPTTGAGGATAEELSHLQHQQQQQVGAVIRPNVGFDGVDGTASGSSSSIRPSGEGNGGGARKGGRKGNSHDNFASSNPYVAHDTPANPSATSSSTRLLALADIAAECHTQQRDVKTECFMVEGGYFGDDRLWVPLSKNEGARLYVAWYREGLGGSSGGSTSNRRHSFIPADWGEATSRANGGGGGGGALQKHQRSSAEAHLAEDEVSFAPMGDLIGNQGHQQQQQGSQQRRLKKAPLASHIKAHLSPLQTHLFYVLFNHSLERSTLFRPFVGLRGKKLKKQPLPIPLLPSLGLPSQHPFVSFHRNHLKPLYIEWVEDDIASGNSNNGGGGGKQQAERSLTQTDRISALLAQDSFSSVAESTAKATSSSTPTINIVRVHGVGYYHAQVSGAYFTNMWHTFGDFYNLLFHTLERFWVSEALMRRRKGIPTLRHETEESSFKHRGGGGGDEGGRGTVEGSSAAAHHDEQQHRYPPLPPLTWVTRTPFSEIAKGCRDSDACRGFTLFDPFKRAFGDKIVFLDDDKNGKLALEARKYLPTDTTSSSEGSGSEDVGSSPTSINKKTFLQFQFAFVGLKNKCCPIPMIQVGTPLCHRSYRNMRDFTLGFLYGLDPLKEVCRPSTAAGSRVVTSGNGGSATPTRLLLHELDINHNITYSAGFVGSLFAQAWDDVRSDASSSASSSPSHHQCAAPFIHIMSRQKDKYRHMYPFDEMVREIRAAADAHTRGVVADAKERGIMAKKSPNGGGELGEESMIIATKGEYYNPTVQPHLITLHGGMSFKEQIRTIHNSTMLVAGRGAGTSLSLFLPIGASFLSISGSDRWNPWRDLHPIWYHFEHYTAQFVHHEDPNRRPQLFGGGVDGNRAAYKVEPKKVGEAVKRLLEQTDKGLLTMTPKPPLDREE